MDNIIDDKMKFAILFIIGVVMSLPFDQKNSPQYIPAGIVNRYPGKVAIDAIHLRDADPAKIAGNVIGIRRNVENSANRGIDLADLSLAELVKLQIRIRGKITGKVPLDARSTSLRAAAAEIMQYGGSIWIRAEGDNGVIHGVGGSITFDDGELDKLVREELVKLGVKLDNAVVIVESVEVEHIEILAFSELADAGERVVRSRQKKEAGLSDTPQIEPALRIRIGGKINVRIRFADPTVSGPVVQLAQDRGSLWIRGEASKEGSKIEIGGTIKFSAEELNAVEDIEILPVESNQPN